MAPVARKNGDIERPRDLNMIAGVALTAAALVAGATIAVILALGFADAERDRFRLEQVNLTASGAVTRVINDFQPQVIVNLAAIPYIPECEETPRIAVPPNVLGAW